MNQMTKRYILTGMPGSGKTSVLQYLEGEGVSQDRLDKELRWLVVQEAATEVIALEQKRGVPQPWEAPDFLDKIVILQKERQRICDQQMTQQGRAVNGPSIAFYDRSPFCTYALGVYLAQLKGEAFSPSHTLSKEMDRCLGGGIYEKQVFFFENLGFIEFTKARQISYEEALIFEKIHIDVYQQFGFDIIFVSKGTITQRGKFVMGCLKKLGC